MLISNFQVHTLILVHFSFAASRQTDRTYGDGKSRFLVWFFCSQLMTIFILLLQKCFCKQILHIFLHPASSVLWVLWIPFNTLRYDISRLSVKTPNVYVNPKREQYIRNPVQQKIQQFKRFIENYRRHIVCFIIIYGITAGVALERCYCEYSSTSTVCLVDAL